MIKIDTHTHTSGVSFCSELPPKVFVRLFKLAGVDTLVLANHYSYDYMHRYGHNFDSQIERFLGEYREVKEEGLKIGVKVLLGAEVLPVGKNGYNHEFLLFGTDEQFFLSNPRLYDYDQRGLYKICSDNGILMYQSHPFRAEHGHKPADPEFMDGVEINLHPYFLRHDDKVIEFADKHDLGISCGSDAHCKDQPGRGGIFCPKAAGAGPKKLAEYLKQNKRPKIFFDGKTVFRP